MKYIAIDGTQLNSIKETMNYDIDYVNNNCVVIQNKRYALYKIETLEQLIPLLYGRYKISYLELPAYFVKDKQEHTIKLLNTKDKVEAVNRFIKGSL